MRGYAPAMAERAQAASKTIEEIEEIFFRDYRPTSLVRRFTSAGEVANLAVYLCGAGASATLGAAMHVDGRSHSIVNV